MISIKKYSEPPFDMGEILRYMGCAKEDDGALSLAEDCLEKCKGIFSYSVCYDIFPVSLSDDGVVFPFAKIPSASLARHLDGYDSAAIFAATVGMELDRLIMKYSRISPSAALAYQAIGAERIEALCDLFCADLAAQYSAVTRRFSPGYSDLPLEFQTDIFRVLDCNRKIGLSLNSALLMSPSKSVTAIIGVKQ